MNRKYYAEKIKHILCNDSSYGSFHKFNFDNYDFGEMTPINYGIIKSIPNGKIILSEDVLISLMAVCDVTSETNEEFPFFLFGNDVGNNTIFFVDFYSYSDNRESSSVSFNDDMLLFAEKKIREYKNIDGKKLVVCKGHSHPSIGSFYDNFSLGDFVSFMKMNLENDVFRSRDVELVSCLVNQEYDIKFLFYDNYYDDFYRFANVVIKDKNGNEKPIDFYLNSNKNMR